MISRKMMTKICAETLKTVSRMGKKGFKKDFPVLPPRKLLHVYFIDKSYGFSSSIWNQFPLVSITKS